MHKIILNNILFSLHFLITLTICEGLGFPPDCGVNLGLTREKDLRLQALHYPQETLSFSFL